MLKINTVRIRRRMRNDPESAACYRAGHSDRLLPHNVVY